MKRITDKQRLDWMNIAMRYNYYGSNTWTIDIKKPGTLRQAIDAAIKDEEKRWG